MIVRQAANVLDLLEYFAKTRRAASMAELSSSLGWPRSSTFNVLTTLAQRGYLYEPRPHVFYPTPRWMSVLQSICEAEVLPEVLCTAVDNLAVETGETVAVAGSVGVNSIYLYVAESAATIRYSAPVGTQMPIHATAVGRALLAQYSPAERLSLLKKVSVFEQYPNRWAPRNAEDVEADIKRAVTRGWHENVGGMSTDHTGIAIPAALVGRRLAIVVAGPTGRMRKRVAEIAASIRRAIKTHKLSSL
jgi:IclR family acetate operon transcriptional repressor